MKGLDKNQESVDYGFAVPSSGKHVFIVDTVERRPGASDPSKTNLVITSLIGDVKPVEEAGQVKFVEDEDHDKKVTIYIPLNGTDNSKMRIAGIITVAGLYGMFEEAFPGDDIEADDERVLDKLQASLPGRSIVGLVEVKMQKNPKDPEGPERANVNVIRIEKDPRALPAGGSGGKAAAVNQGQGAESGW